LYLSSKKKERGKNKGQKKEAGTQTSFVKGSLEAFYKKIPCPTQVWGRCNEEETDWEKQRKERKQSKASKGTKRHKTKNKRKQMAGSGQTDMRDIYPCAAVVVDYLFVSKWLGLGYCLVQ
jgi:hypothetical protein